MLLAAAFLIGRPLPSSAATPAATPAAPRAAAKSDRYQATTSDAARRSALQSIPYKHLDAAARAKVNAVLTNVSLFRRMPTHVVDCDPHLYLFLIRHPDVVVNIWEELKLSELKLREAGTRTYRVIESAGTSGVVQFLYSSADTQLIYAQGSYLGPLFGKRVNGTCLMVLKTGYVRETNGRYYITSRLDTFLAIEQGGAELLAKTFQPWMGKTADSNFVQSIDFLGSLSKTAEENSQGVQRLASRLLHVKPEYRAELSRLAASVAQRQVAAKPAAAPRVAVREPADAE